ncbi:MAG: EboA domain-containing protein [Hyphomicrobium sp.]|jgi:hypothetical protein|nr:EboA domain-containing protein [Hyphomicrobium sp.]
MIVSQDAAVQISKAEALLHDWLSRRLSSEALAWLDQQIKLLETGQRPQQLAIAIGLAPRKVGKADLDLTAAELQAAHDVRPGLDPGGWSVDQAARILLVLASAGANRDAFAESLERVFAAAEIGEQIALLRGLPLLPEPERLMPYAAEGVRSAMQPIFEAVAHRNPYPRERFSEAQWNQMVVKTLFIGSRLSPIQGLDDRRNADLAQMLVDYAAERRAAGRPISPELWRCVAPFARDDEVAALSKILLSGTQAERSGAALALHECPVPSAKAALRPHANLVSAIEAGRLSWNSIS